MISYLWYFLRLTRPLFLAGGAVMYLIGAAAAISKGAVLQVDRLILGQALVTFTQLMTHYTNEYFDFECDRHNANRTWLSGGSGVLINGLLPNRTAFIAGTSCAFFAGILLLIIGSNNSIVFWFGLIVLVIGWSYSSPPLRLIATGWGEISASFVVAVFTPLTGYLIQKPTWPGPVFWYAVVPLWIIHLAMLIVFDIPDLTADARAGKGTLLVRMGLPRALATHTYLLSLAIILIMMMAAAGIKEAAYQWMIIPLAFWQIFSVSGLQAAPTISYRWLTLRSMSLFAISAFLWLLGFLSYL